MDYIKNLKKSASNDIETESYVSDKPSQNKPSVKLPLQKNLPKIDQKFDFFHSCSKRREVWGKILNWKLGTDRAEQLQTSTQ